ncbi:serine/arginine repetitive matrix protein 1-like isoform X1 [Gallus gallus]|uniref:serine/arginine repetitive matrix protein 1-like isoform X1 n=1 Tax=Gallus gallus TaxID=9031 RepID=UPI001AE7C80E|nr:serine/arginine repetitive matrix protein 1-like isoform X1 [Gallus gallus]
MSSGMAGANTEQPAGTRRNRTSEAGPAARRASRATDTNTEERVAVWDAVAAYVQEHLLVQKGVWIPTFGSFDTISKDIRTADGTVTLRWPVFQLARNLRAMHHLGSDKDSLPAHREVETLKYSEVAAAASVTWQRGKTCIQSTVSLLSNCLKNGENVAFVLKDVGVLLFEGMSFGIKYYYDFLEKLSGKEKFRKAVFKAPWLLDTLVSRVAPVASLTHSGRLVVFPMFQKQVAPKPPPKIFRKASGDLHGEGKQKKEGALPPLVRGKKVRFDEVPTYIRRFSMASTAGQSSGSRRSLQQKESFSSSPLPAVPRTSEAREQPVSRQLQGQAGNEGQEHLGQTTGKKHVRFRGDEQGAGQDHEAGAAAMWKAKASHPQVARRQVASRIKERRCSLRAESSLSRDTKGHASRPPLLPRDSVKLLRQRQMAKEDRPAQAEPRETAASPFHRECSLPEEPSTCRSGSLPPIRNRPESPRSPPPRTTAPRRRPPTPYPFLPRDSVKLLRQRQMAKEDRPAQAEPRETAASPFHRECSLPEEPSTSRSGLLPPIRNRPESPRSPPPRTTAPRRRPPTPYPR